MKLRTQLLLINLFTMALLIAALVVSYSRMLLSLHQTWLLTGIALGAGCISSAAFGIMTLPITKSLFRLVHFSDRVAEGDFRAQISINTGSVEVRHLAESLQTMAERLAANFEQLERMERTRRELVANVSHDLRTPLASIQSYAEALQDRLVTNPEDIEKYVQTIHSETERLSALIHDLFELSKLEAGQENLNPSLARLDQVLIEVLDSQRLALLQKSIDVNVDMKDDVPSFYFSPQKIHRVISNLLQNAIRYAPNHSVIQISVTLTNSAKEVELSIQDAGPGIDIASADRLFERFFRADPSRTRASGGAGLGLAISKWLVELHRGAIGVRARTDGQMGSVFWFSLPIVTENSKTE